jgi:hypothetical protein
MFDGHTLQAEQCGRYSSKIECIYLCHIRQPQVPKLFLQNNVCRETVFESDKDAATAAAFEWREKE